MEDKLYRVKVSDIKWDVSDEDREAPGIDGLDLPEEMDLEIPLWVTEGLDAEEVGPAVEDWLSDTISDLTGFCHDGFSWRFVAELEPLI